MHKKIIAVNQADHNKLHLRAMVCQWSAIAKKNKKFISRLFRTIQASQSEFGFTDLRRASHQILQEEIK
jgi:hypothetical protein